MAAEQPKKRGRPLGKRSDKLNYCQVCGYIKRTTYREVRKKLIDADQEFSELLQELLDQWLENQQSD